jgi:hypothetical protein
MKIFGLVSLVIAASASFAAADKLAKFEGDLTAIALPLSQRTPQPAVWIGAQYLQDWNARAPFPHSYSCCAHCPTQNAFALMIEMSGAFGTLGDEMAGVSGGIMTNVFSNAHNLLEAMNVAFASATSEIAASEMGGGSFAVRLPSIHAPITRSRHAALDVYHQQKRVAIAEAFSLAFMQTGTTVNTYVRSPTFPTSVHAHSKIVRE